MCFRCNVWNSGTLYVYCKNTRWLKGAEVKAVCRLSSPSHDVIVGTSCYAPYNEGCDSVLGHSPCCLMANLLELSSAKAVTIKCISFEELILFVQHNCESSISDNIVHFFAHICGQLGMTMTIEERMVPMF